MGHTNYWTRRPELPAKEFAAAVKDIKTIIKKLGVPLGGRDGTGRPIFRADLIAFNGRSPQDYEIFAVESVVEPEGEPMVFNFCKTDHRPYDLCVQAALIVLKHHLGTAITVSSDGSDVDWEAAREKCQAHLRYGGDFKLEKWAGEGKGEAVGWGWVAARSCWAEMHRGYMPYPSIVLSLPKTPSALWRNDLHHLVAMGFSRTIADVSWRREG